MKSILLLNFKSFSHLLPMQANNWSLHQCLIISLTCLSCCNNSFFSSFNKLGHRQTQSHSHMEHHGSVQNVTKKIQTGQKTMCASADLHRLQYKIAYKFNLFSPGLKGHHTLPKLLKH